MKTKQQFDAVYDAYFEEAIEMGMSVNQANEYAVTKTESGLYE